MPKVNFWHFPGQILNTDPHQTARRCGWTPEALKMLGKQLQPIIAAACSTERIKLAEDDIDWVPCPYPEGTLVAASCSLEIETFGYPERIAQLTEERVIVLKRTVVHIINNLVNDLDLPEYDRKYAPNVDGNQPLIWIKYLGPEGVHV